MLLKQKKFTKALEDCNAAIAIDPNHEQSYFRKGTACFELEEYESAKKAFEKGMTFKQAEGKDVSTYARFIRKCDAEIVENVEIPDIPFAASASASAGIPRFLIYFINHLYE